VSGNVEALLAVEEWAVVVHAFVVELGISSLPAASKRLGALLQRRPIEQTGALLY
jgi:hypothetical protein